MDPAHRYKFPVESTGLGFAKFGFTQLGISQFSSFQSRPKFGNNLANFLNFKKLQTVFSVCLACFVLWNVPRVLQSLIHSRVKRSHPEFLTNKAIRLLEEATLALDRAKRDRDQVLDDVEDESQPSPQKGDKNIRNNSLINEENSFAELLKLETGNPVPQWPSKYLSYAPDSIRVFQEPAFLQDEESQKKTGIQENNDSPTKQKLKSLQADLDPGKLLPKYPKYPDDIFKPDYNSETCSPEKHIFFLKTHKTASSTIQNILYRYGDTNNLTFAMPRSGNRFMYPFYIRKTMLRPETHYNIICNHMRYQRGILDPLFYERN